MIRIVALCMCVLALSGCDVISEWFAPPPPPPPDENQEPELRDKLIFSRTFSGSSNDAFAVIRLYRESFFESRLVLEATKFLDAYDLDLALPACLKVAGGSNTGSYQWKGILTQPGIYERVVQCEQFTSDCPPNGTLFFTLSSGSIGDSGSIPFTWPEGG